MIFNFFNPKPIKPENPIELTLHGDPIKVLVRRSIRSKRISIKIKQDRSELVLPIYGDLKLARDFLFSKELWIRESLKRQANQATLPSNTILLFNKPHKLVYEIGKPRSVKIVEDNLIITAPENGHKNTLFPYLKKRLHEEIIRISGLIIAKDPTYSYFEIKISKTVSKWGSCSSKKILSFNLLLVFAPMEIVEYVVIHEMCHLKEMNHSKNFWALVTSFFPHHKVAKSWLKQSGKNLHRMADSLGI